MTSQNSSPAAGLDVGEPGLVAGLDAGLEAGLDAGLDAGLEAGLNAGLDAGLNAFGLDASVPKNRHTNVLAR